MRFAAIIVGVDTEQRLAAGATPLTVEAPTEAVVRPQPGAGGSERRFPPPALRVRTYRWYWIAQWPVLVGTWMQIVALGYLVFQVTGSTTAVSVVAAAQGLPAFVLPIVGGARC